MEADEKFLRSFFQKATTRARRRTHSPLTTYRTPIQTRYPSGVRPSAVRKREEK